MFLWSILQKTDKELVRKVYNLQKTFPVKDDWILQIGEDLKECQIEFDEEIICSMSKYSFKKLVKEKIYMLAFSYLLDEKSKIKKLVNLSTWKMQDYLLTEKLSLSEKGCHFHLEFECWR